MRQKPRAHLVLALLPQIFPQRIIQLTPAFYFMLKYTGELYARFGRKYCPTGKTGADWDALESDNAKARELLGEVLSATVDAGLYPDGPCLQKDLSDEVRHFLANAKLRDADMTQPQTPTQND